MASPQVHLKGRMLQLLQQDGPQWDYELYRRLASEYGLPDGEYWYGTVRVTLADLFSGGLIEPVEEKLEPEMSYEKEKVLFKFALTEFGMERMQDTKLVREVV